MADERASRHVVILGHAIKSKHFDSYPWDAIPNSTNLVDYDDVIMDFVPFTEPGRVRAAAHQVVNSIQCLRHFLRNESRTVIIGPPNSDLRRYDEELGLDRIGIPVDLLMRAERGQIFENVSEGFESYFRMCDGWMCHLQDMRRVAFEEEAANLLSPGAKGLRFDFGALATTKAGEALAFILRVTAKGRDTEARSGRLWWLPPTAGPPEDAVLWVLNNTLGIKQERPEPSWASEYRIPGEDGIEIELVALRDQMTKLRETYAQAQERRRVLTQFRRLLYENEDPLEVIVRDTFRELGAKVEDPEVRGKDDGRVIDPYGRKFLLEVKGRGGTLKRQDVRELDDWVQEAAEKDHWKGKGLLVANLLIGADLPGRKDLVPPNCRELLERNGSCLLLSTQLFRAFVDHREGSLDLRAFWDALWNTSGIATQPEPTPDARKALVGAAGASTAKPS
jgi:hypothetical protein